MSPLSLFNSGEAYPLENATLLTVLEVPTGVKAAPEVAPETAFVPENAVRFEFVSTPYVLYHSTTLP